LTVPLALDANRGKPELLKKLRPAAKQLPPALASSALAQGIGDATAKPGKWGWGTRSATTNLALLALYPAAFGLLLARRLRHQYSGEELGEERAAAKPRTAATPAGGWHLPGVSGAAAAMFEKELRYFLRSGMMLMNVVMPVLLMVFFAALWSRPVKNPGPEFLMRAPELMYPAAVGYVALVLAQLAYNSLAYDARGIQLLYAAPVRFREVLLGKNLAYAALFAFDAAFILVVLVVFGFAPNPVSVATTLAGLAFVMLAHFGVGNVMSLQFPKAYDFEMLKQRARGMTIFVYFVAQVVVMGLAGSILAFSQVMGGQEIALVIFLVLDAVGLKLYLMLLDRCSEIAQEQREELAAELCK
jgi:ABC-2 type transport system permease protein